MRPAHARLACALLALAAAPALVAAGPPSVIVRVVGLRSARGALSCSMFTEKGFPEDADPRVPEQRAPIAPDRTATCRFDDVPPGEWAVEVMHDENDNGKMDFNFLGMPKEGYGVSNNHTHALAPPRWKDSRFELRPGEEVRLEIRIRY